MKNGIAVVGNVFVDIKGFPLGKYIPGGRNAGRVETVHGGVGRNVAEDIANLELRPTFVSLVDTTAQGEDVVRKLKNHKVNTSYIPAVEDGMGIWLAVFNERGDVEGAISKRPVMKPLADLVERRGDEIFSQCDSIVIEIDLDKEIVKTVLAFAENYHKKVFAVVANMSIACQRRDLLQRIDCFVCNQQEAGLLFAGNYDGLSRTEMEDIIAGRVAVAAIPSMVVTMGAEGAVFASANGEHGSCEACNVQVCDTTGAGDAFCAGVAVGLTYGKALSEAVEIGTRLAASVITVSENVCPRFLPSEFDLPGKEES